MVDIKEFKVSVDSFYRTMEGVSEKQASIKLSEDKWSLKEIIGHLIDSASNNHQRFLRLQSDDLLDFPPYDGEKWIRLQKYNDMNWSTIVSFWYNYNLLLLNIIKNVEDSSLANVWIKGETAIPLEKLINDYYGHIKIHVKHFEERFAETAGNI